MKRKRMNRNTLSSVLVKAGVCILFLGIAYGLFCSSLGQLSPFLVADDDKDDLMMNTPPTQHPPPRATHHNHTSSGIVSEKCNLFIGDWIPDSDGSMYTNSTCNTIESPQNCIKNGRPDSDYIYWRWKPRGCNLPKFHPNKFLNKMRHKSLAFIGDSIMRNHVQSLLCMLSQAEQGVDIYHDKAYKNRKWYFPSHDFTVSLFWSPFLTRADTFEDENGVSNGMVRLHLDKLDTVWTEQYKDQDYVVIAGGKWFLKTALYYENNTLIGCHNCHRPNVTQLGFPYAYRKVLNSTLNFITGSTRSQFVLFRTWAPDHFENGEWNTGGYCNRTGPFKTGEIDVNYIDGFMRRIELEVFESAAEVGLVNGMRLKLFDTTHLSLLRPDGHPGVYRRMHPYAGKDKHAKIQNDCLHWCLPGPIDSWNDLMMEMLLKD